MLRRMASGAGIEFVPLRSTGGHEVFSFGGLRIVIPSHRMLAGGTAASILRQAERRLEQEEGGP